MSMNTQRKHWQVSGFTVTEYNDYWLRVCDERDVPMAYVRNREDAALVADAPDMLASLQELVMLAQEMHDHWDNDRDMKVGKYLLALSGALPGYDKRIDAIHATIAKAKGAA